MIDDRACEKYRKRENIYKEHLVLFRFISKLFNSYYLFVGEDSVRENFVDDL